MSAEEGSPSGSGAAAEGSERRLDFHPGIEMRWEITRSTADTGGELFEATNWLDARMTGPPVHVHPTAEESYEVIEGALDVFVDGEWRTLRAGETATAPAGVPHTLRNATAEPVRLVNIHRPALQFESFFRQMHALIHQGKIKRLPPRSLVRRSTWPCCSASIRTRPVRRSRQTASSRPSPWSTELRLEP